MCGVAPILKKCDMVQWLLLAVLSIATLGQRRCPIGLVEGEHFCFTVATSPTTANFIQMCVAHGLKSVSILSEADNELVASMNYTGKARMALPIIADSNSVFAWIGAPQEPPYSNWASQEPQLPVNTTLPRCGAMIMTGAERGQWVTSLCLEYTAALCGVELLPIASTTVPPTTVPPTTIPPTTAPPTTTAPVTGNDEPVSTIPPPVQAASGEDHHGAVFPILLFGGGLLTGAFFSFIGMSLLTQHSSETETQRISHQNSNASALKRLSQFREAPSVHTPDV